LPGVLRARTEGAAFGFAFNLQLNTSQDFGSTMPETRAGGQAEKHAPGSCRRPKV
jgi:hypothetical protein